MPQIKNIFSTKTKAHIEVPETSKSRTKTIRFEQELMSTSPQKVFRIVRHTKFYEDISRFHVEQIVAYMWKHEANGNAMEVILKKRRRSRVQCPQLRNIQNEQRNYYESN